MYLWEKQIPEEPKYTYEAKDGCVNGHNIEMLKNIDLEECQ
jgi:hypothetical protein